jgi:predicted metal-binding membrane protein
MPYLLGSISVMAWVTLALDASDFALPAVCSVGTLWALPLSSSFGFAMLFSSPEKLASGWALMLAAMMPPIVIAPLRHVRDRSFASRRARAMLLFVAGYASVWMVAGAGIQVLALAVRGAALPALLGLGAAAATAVLWQTSPAKQWCLNRCHRLRQLAAFGAAADRDALMFGLTHGASCAGACWVLMLLPLVVGHGHLFGMLVVTLFIFAERLDHPAPLQWRWRGPGKAWRIATVQVRMRLGAIRRVRRSGRLPGSGELPAHRFGRAASLKWSQVACQAPPPDAMPPPASRLAQRSAVLAAR